MNALGFIVILVFFQSIWAAPRRIDPLTLKSEYEQIRKSIVETDEKQRQIMSALFDINRKTKKIVTERSRTEQERLVLEASTKDLATKILELESKIKTQRSLLQVRLNAIYKLGGQGLARILFSSSNSSQLERNLKILGLVAKQDLALMRDYSAVVKELAVKQNKFVQRLTQLRTVEKKIAYQEGLIQKESKQKSKVLDGIRSHKLAALSRLSALRKKSKDWISSEDELLDLLLQPSFFEQKGQLVAPVSGPIAKRFGLWKDEKFDVAFNHKGVTFQSQLGSDVKSVFQGRVVFQGDLQGWGQTMIIDHGDHYYSVYSGLGPPATTQGQVVTQGQKIAGASEQTYFEIRHFSEPYNPLQWMKGTQQ